MTSPGRAPTRWNDLAAAVAILALGACGGGSCAGCDVEPLPEGGLPAGQTIEGAAQARVTPTGFRKIKDIVPGVINDAFADGVCIPKYDSREDPESDPAIEYNVCRKNQCEADPSSNPGCQVDFNIDDITVEPVGAHTLRVAVQADGHSVVPAKAFTIFGDPSCDFEATLDNGRLAVDVDVGVDPQSGELSVGLAGIHELDFSDLDLASSGGCGVLADITQGIIDGLSTSIGNAIADFATPLLDDVIQGFLPDPLGLEGVVGVDGLLAGLSTSEVNGIELRAVPGGYASLGQRGLNLGVIAGINSDRDPQSRGAGEASEPARCVPPVAPPDFSSDPADLARGPRGTFQLQPAGAFVGRPDPDGEDLVFGMSESALDLAGHHAFASGALCLGVDSTMVSQLNLGTVGILVPSLARLGSDQGNDPMLIVTRPQKAIDFTIGEGTEESPNLTAHLEQFEVDIYAFLFERWVRGFTLSVDLDVGLNVEFTTDDAGNPAILPTLVGLDTDNIGIEVKNPEFLREDKDTLEDVLPTLFNLVVPLLGQGLGTFTIPEFAGFTLTELDVSQVTTPEDEFLSIAGAFGASSVVARLAERYPSLRDLPSARRAPQPARASTRAELSRVTTPEPAAVRAALEGAEGGALPEVVIDVAEYDDQGRRLEWTWNIDGGMWRSFTSESPLVIRDRAFAFQGRYDIQVRARVAGDYRTLDDDPITIPVVIDSAPPRILADRASREGGRLEVPATDAVSPASAIERALGHPDDGEPATSFARGALDVDAARELAGDAGNVRVFARDEGGNVSSALVDLTELGVAAGGGCRVSASASGGAGGGVAVLLFAGLVAGAASRRRGALAALARRALALAPLALAAGGLSLTLGCGGSAPAGDDGGPICETADDCTSECEDDQAPTCMAEMCLCDDDVPLGRVGQHSAMALDASGGAWVSAYNSTYGDLMVAHTDGAGRIGGDAWEFVDGVPEGPVIVENSRVRGGIFAPGEDVGRYTDVAVAEDGTVMVSYFAKDAASLKLASFGGDGWDVHTVDAGRMGEDADVGFEIVGRYSSITLGADGTPGIAYLAQVSEGEGRRRSEVRFARASSPRPGDEVDWTVVEIDAAAVAETGEDDADPFPIPRGLGLYIDTARARDGRTTVVYYDRAEGALRMSQAASGGSFSQPEVVGGGGDADVGRFPSVAIDDAGTPHVTYVGAGHSSLYYLDTSAGPPEVIDDGYRIVGTTETGEPKPEFHFVGDDSSLVLAPSGPSVAYQDATTHELLLARRGGGDWDRTTIAGDEEPFAGGYGFYTTSQMRGSEVVISNWVLDQPNNDSWIEVHRHGLVE